MRFLAIDSKKNIIHSTGSTVSTGNFIRDGKPKFQKNGRPAIGLLSQIALVTKRSKKQ
jgi:hypothetical protein